MGCWYHLPQLSHWHPSSQCLHHPDNGSALMAEGSQIFHHSNSQCITFTLFWEMWMSARRDPFLWFSKFLVLKIYWCHLEVDSCSFTSPFKWLPRKPKMKDNLSVGRTLHGAFYSHFSWNNDGHKYKFIHVWLLLFWWIVMDWKDQDRKVVTRKSREKNLLITCWE